MRDEGTGTSILLETERLFLREMDRNDYDALYRVLASVISKEDWLSEIGAEVVNQQKEGLQDGI